ncbi:MoaD/ThiS family protein [Candidatus Pacearchaeota archaeon]|nr:MoaD/ThiS family protein [Candidatus Pacearchaeota archaeon]
MVTIRLPAVLAEKGERELSYEGYEGKTVKEVLDKFFEEHPIKARLYDTEGRLHKFINIYVDDEDIRFLDNLETKLKDSSVISIIPSIAGG